MVQMTAVQTIHRVKCNQIIASIGVLCLCLSVTISYSEEQKKPVPWNINGEIILDVVVPREKHNKFLVTPREERIIALADSAEPESIIVNSGKSSLSNCYTNPVSHSPNNRFVAECSAPRPGSTEDHFVLRRADSKGFIYQRDLHQRIIDSQWSKDSQGIAVLAMTVHVSLNPLYWFLALSGHPVQYETYSLHMIDVESLKVVTLKIPIEASSSAGYIVTWR